LVALSSAAVLAVYSAGYARTRSAADQLEAQSAERRPPPPGMGRRAARAGSPSGASSQQVQENSAGNAPAPSDFAPQPHNSDNQPALLASVEPLRSASSTGPAASASSSTSAISALSVATSSAPAQSAQPSGSQQTQAPQSQASSYSSSAPSSSAFQIPLIPPIEHKTETVSAAPAKAAAPAWKDGTYFGWGSCRHGDIQAEVYVEGGRIIVASISDCRTRYSCNVIDKLPPEVAQRQSPEVDYVSGATESATAFYYAVVDALSKAK